MMNFAHPHFAEPRWLWFAVLGPLALVALQRYSGWQRGRQLARIAAVLSKAHVNIEYIYASAVAYDQQAMVIVHVPDSEAAEKALRAAKIS